MLDLQNLKTSDNKQAYNDLITVAVFHKERLSRVHTASRIHFEKPFVLIYRMVLNATNQCNLTYSIFFSFTDIVVTR